MPENSNSSERQNNQEQQPEETEIDDLEQDDPKTKLVAVRMSAEMHKRLSQQARRKHWKVSSLIRIVMEEWLETQEA